MVTQNIEREKIQFVCPLSLTAKDLRTAVELWKQSGYSANPFRNSLITPLFARKSTLDLVRNLKEQGIIENLIFDSGGYQVQKGTMSYQELSARLYKLYTENTWADYFILPDSPPSNGDTCKAMYDKVLTTVQGTLSFLADLPSYLQDKSIPVIQGVTEDQVFFCFDKYRENGFNKMGFGSFLTKGAQSEVNVLSMSSVQLLSKLIKRDTANHIHAFGIGSPPVAYSISKLQVGSFDSSGWIKSAGYGNAFLPFIRAYNVSYKNLSQKAIAEQKFRELKSMTGHSCPFCDDFQELSNTRAYRMVHNLICTIETINSSLPTTTIESIIEEHSPWYVPLIQEVAKVS